MQHEGLKAILAKVEEDRRDQARRDLRPYLLGGSEAPPAEVCYVLGRSFYGEDNGTARYLFEMALSADPEFREAGEYEARCGSGLHDLETFNDERHPPCEACHLRYRDTEPQCPYCGAWPDSGENEQVKESSFESQFRIAREEMKESFRNLSESEQIKRAREKAEAASKVAYRRAREFGESDTAKEWKDKARAIGVVVGRRAKALGEREDVQSARKRASDLGHGARDKAKAFSEREEVKESLDKASKTTKNVMGKAQDYVKAEQERFNKGDATVRAIILGKWFVAGLVILWLLKWLLGGD